MLSGYNYSSKHCLGKIFSPVKKRLTEGPKLEKQGFLEDLANGLNGRGVES